MNHMDVLHKHVIRLKKENRQIAFSEEDIAAWKKMLKDIQSLMKYGEALFGLEVVPLPSTLQRDELDLCLENLSAVPEKNVVLAIKKWNSEYDLPAPLGECRFAIDESKPYYIHYLSPNKNETLRNELQRKLQYLCENWDKKYYRKTEDHLKVLMQNYIKENMSI